MYGVDDDDASSAISIDWLVGVKGGDDDPPFARFSHPEGHEQLVTAGVLLSGLSTMKWVAPGGPAAGATAARARQAAADAAALVSSSDDDDSGDEE
jgi:hypothetical protein